MLGNLLWKVIGNRFGAVVIGLVMVAISVLAFDSSTVSCGEREMRPPTSAAPPARATPWFVRTRSSGTGKGSTRRA